MRRRDRYSNRQAGRWTHTDSDTSFRHPPNSMSQRQEYHGGSTKQFVQRFGNIFWDLSSLAEGGSEGGEGMLPVAPPSLRGVWGDATPPLSGGGTTLPLSGVVRETPRILSLGEMLRTLSLGETLRTLSLGCVCHCVVPNPISLYDM